LFAVPAHYPTEPRQVPRLCSGKERGSAGQRPYVLRSDFAVEVDLYVGIVAVGLGFRCTASAKSKLAVMWIRISVFVEKIELA
jgi:hypothetical protein